MDETHFLLNYDNGKSLVFVVSEDVKYADTEESGGLGMKVVVRISLGRYGFIHQAFFIFRNKDKNFPTRNVPGVFFFTCKESNGSARIFRMVD